MSSDTREMTGMIVNWRMLLKGGVTHDANSVTALVTLLRLPPASLQNYCTSQGHSSCHTAPTVQKFHLLQVI
jgi:hypothetical protein